MIYRLNLSTEQQLVEPCKDLLAKLYFINIFFLITNHINILIFKDTFKLHHILLYSYITLEKLTIRKLSGY
jgi:hypothetical protein